MKASLTEIMESIQGEGLLLGSRQVFLRFAGCNLKCSYCDTPASLEAMPYCHVTYDVGRGGTWQDVPNPLPIDRVIEIINHYSSRWVSLTGGEPLLWSDFIQELGDRLKSMKYNLLLETNGTLFEQLEKCLPFVDVISMDFKLPSATGQDNWARHEQFLRRAVNKPTYIKMVVEGNSPEAEIKQAVKLIASVKKDIPLILQPATPTGGIVPPDMAIILNLQKMCLQDMKDVRIIPQIHKYLGLI